MAENVLPSGNELMDSIRLKVKSLTALLSEIKQPNNNYEFDPSICNDIYAYINIVQTDCQKLVNDNKFDSFRATQPTDGKAFHGFVSFKTKKTKTKTEHFFRVKIQTYRDRYIVCT